MNDIKRSCLFKANIFICVLNKELQFFPQESTSFGDVDMTSKKNKNKLIPQIKNLWSHSRILYAQISIL